MSLPFFETTDRGFLPAGSDVTAVLRHGEEEALHATWRTFQHIGYIRRTLAVIDTDKSKALLSTDLRVELAGLAEVTALQALEANRRLTELLTGRRWSVMRSAREAGASWAAVGAALGISKQGAIDWYKRKIEHQEQHLPELHDAARARAVLPEEPM
ncbi:hypothetical protein ACFVMC_32950 [Nocardia sp. NPDC127579]|uniref:hypothetical protein n=1 Tax=Nocardia sp. NPDC127579 TaxID=3345402 RepID=UPI003626CCDE